MTCLECGSPIPAGNGRGRPRKTCSQGCADDRRRRMNKGALEPQASIRATTRDLAHSSATTEAERPDSHDVGMIPDP